MTTPNPMHESKYAYVELYGRAVVINNRLTLALAIALGLCLALVLLNLQTYRHFTNTKPLIIRIDDVGRAEAVTYDATSYVPRASAPELKYFLMQFVTRHYSRVRATIREEWPRSLHYLEAGLSTAILAAARKEGMIEAFLRSQTDEVQINVTRVSIEDVRTSPYRASVDYEKIYYSPYDHVETKREKYTGSFVFVVQDQVPNSLIPYNPLGLTITYFREDQAFQ